MRNIYVVLNFRFIKHLSRNVKATLAAAVLLAWPTYGIAGHEPGSMDAGSITYGPEETFSGIYFSNWENSKFFQCSGVECDAWATQEGEWMNCTSKACQDLEDRAKRIGGNLHGTGGLFEIVFIGRRSKEPSAKTFIHDTVYKVLVERIVTFEKRPPSYR